MSIWRSGARRACVNNACLFPDGASAKLARRPRTTGIQLVKMTSLRKSIEDFFIVSCCYFLVCSARYADANPKTSADTDEAIRRVSEVTQTLVQKLNLPSISVAVAKGNQITWSAAFGYADLENDVAAQTSSRYRIGSVSKTLTSYAVGALVENGALDLDVPIHRYVPYYPKAQWPITIRQLASHTAGIRDYEGDEFLSSKAYSWVKDALAVFSNDPLRFEPGTQYQYSTYGWTVVSTIVEAASQSEFREFMRSSVLEPIGMHDTIAEQMRPLIRKRVHYYERNAAGGLQNAPYADTSNKWAGGGYLSTPKDIALFGNEFLNGSLLSRETRRLLTEKQRLLNGDYIDYGLGWEIRSDPHGNRIVGHSGGSVGGTTMFFIWPSADLIVVMMSNITDDPGLRLFSYAVGEVFLRSSENVANDLRLCNPALTSGVSDLILGGTIRLTESGNDISGTLAVDSIIPRGDVLLGWQEGDSKHLVIATDDRLLHGCLVSEGSVNFGVVWTADGAKHRVELASLP